LAVNVVEVATPLAFVVAVSVFVPPVNVPLAPVVGAVNVTTTPLVGDPLVGDPPVVTVATSNAGKPVPTAALCGVPLVAAIKTTEGAAFELEPQPVKKLKANKTIARMLA
jgi:hypothetical protein